MICLDSGVLVKKTGRGKWFAQWILSNGLRAGGRQKACDTTENWTRKRSSDGMFVQIDLIPSDAKASLEANWNDFMISIGIDHRCVHCRLAFRTENSCIQLQQYGMKHPKLHVDQHGHPTIFHQSMAGRTMKTYDEIVLVSAVEQAGHA